MPTHLLRVFVLTAIEQLSFKHPETAQRASSLRLLAPWARLGMKLRVFSHSHAVVLNQIRLNPHRANLRRKLRVLPCKLMVAGFNLI